MIKTKPSKHYWNYFLSIEEDIEKLARFIEFNTDNLKTYSIELARIYLATSSEIDVLLKQICSKLIPSENPQNINDYRAIIKSNLPEFIDETIFVNRYGFELKPWEAWLNDKNPQWWTHHNKVKHQRNQYYKKANVENVFKAVGALLNCVIYYYKLEFEELYKNDDKVKVDLKMTCQNLNPNSSLFQLKAEYHYSRVLVF